MQHRRAPYLTVAAITAAFVVGGVATPATAGAARLTKAKVEKIAAKVVDQKAPSLKVAHATTADTATKALSADKADDSTKLGGRAGEDYLTKAFVVGSNELASDHVTNVSWTFTDLPQGTYLLRYDLVFNKDDASSAIGCSVSYTDYPYYTPESGSALTTTYIISGSTVVSYDGVHEPRLGCGAQTGKIAVLPPKQGLSTVSLLRIDSTATPTLTTVATNR